MNNINLEIKNRESKKKNQLANGVGGSEQDLFRVIINKSSNVALESVVAKVGDGFDAGTITKSDIANYIFSNLEKFFTDNDTKAMRNLHFDDKKVLSVMLRGAEDSNALPEEIRKALREHYGIVDKERKRNSKTQSDLSTDKVVDKSTST
ncbi:MAG: hypothetical protein AB7F59_09580 [Bdellovibrionales bacterium]